MGVEIELHAERPVLDWKRSRTTLIHGSYEHGDALAEVLLGIDETTRGGLGRVDPYGDTLFNEQQAQAALREVPELFEDCSGPSHRAAVLDLQQLLRSCSQTPGSYLWFVGD
ncbi:hypothetical protein [Streptomyces sp. NRRL B-1347]|uniref:hypothetical protein n=1 Tax=Streptomyces sp. NRRL B-1347 TaxID=1476877 RepID=UPI0004C7AE05|nr:hypothetical protein [Streptomyces sp. NRRL B-1347]